jgi:hypothetical protein
LRWWLVLLPLFGLGCSRGDALVPVAGTVLFKTQPAEGVVVTFHREGADAIATTRPVGFTDKEGAFTLSTGAKEGAAAGAYVVTFVWPKQAKTKNEITGTAESRDELDGAYADVGRSQFKVAINPGTSKLPPFVLK